MNKFIYCVGVYAICVYTHETLYDLKKYLNHKAEEYRKRNKKSEEKKNRSVNLSIDSVGGPMDRIGF